jgi:hypothetical protein
VPQNRIDRNGRALLNTFPHRGPDQSAAARFHPPRQLRPCTQTLFYWRGINDYEAFKRDFCIVLACGS